LIEPSGQRAVVQLSNGTRSTPSVMITCSDACNRPGAQGTPQVAPGIADGLPSSQCRTGDGWFSVVPVTWGLLDRGFSCVVACELRARAVVR
jgi:hypothetical protein